MRALIAGGRSRTDFLITSLREEHHNVVVINNDRTYCEYLAANHDIPIICGDATKRYVLDSADIMGFDVVFALTNRDAANLVICQECKRFYHIKKAVCTVNNPLNVEIFKHLGISTVISTTFVLSQLIAEASTDATLISELDEIESRLYRATAEDLSSTQEFTRIVQGKHSKLPDPDNDRP